MGAFIKTFFGVFIVLMFILVLQFIWLHIKDLAGKDLDYIVIGKVLLYTIPVVVPLALPLAILLTSIMVFGNFAENYEFAAMKANGISLQRAMRGLMIFIGILGITAFFFANNVIPWGEFKQINLRRNIINAKPAMVIAEGRFNQIGDINIKVHKKSGDRGQYLDDVIIHKKNKRTSANRTVIKSETGELKSSLESNVIQLILHDGNYYDDIQPTDFKQRQKLPFVRTAFEEYKLNIDVSGLNDSEVSEEGEKDNQKMLRISELNVAIDSLTENYNERHNNYATSQITKWSPDVMSKPAGNEPVNILSNQRVDTLEKEKYTGADPLSELEPSQQRRSLQNARNKITGQISSVNNRKRILASEIKKLNKFSIALHKKYVLGAACIILFFIGAPLGAIIRKGGMGLPLVIAIVFFLAYHFIGIFAEHAAESDKMPAWLGAWLSTIIIFPLGIWLTYRATTDQGIMAGADFFTNLARLFKFKKSKDNPGS